MLMGTLTVNVIGGYELPGCRTSLLVQVRVPKLQPHPVPPMAVATSVLGTLGKVSTTVTVPFVGPTPVPLLTVMVYTPVEPRLKLPAWVLVIERAAGLIVNVADAELPFPPFVEVTAPVVLL